MIVKTIPNPNPMHHLTRMNTMAMEIIRRAFTMEWTRRRRRRGGRDMMILMMVKIIMMNMKRERSRTHRPHRRADRYPRRSSHWK